MHDLPIGVQTFKNMRENDYVYVDKAEFIYDIAKKMVGGYFLSRPWRFGKSLLANTFKELFLGNEKLFQGLWITPISTERRTKPSLELVLVLSQRVGK